MLYYDDMLLVDSILVEFFYFERNLPLCVFGKERREREWRLTSERKMRSMTRGEARRIRESLMNVQLIVQI
jgi:hypothetical protein